MEKIELTQAEVNERFNDRLDEISEHCFPENMLFGIFPKIVSAKTFELCEKCND